MLFLGKSPPCVRFSSNLQKVFIFLFSVRNIFFSCWLIQLEDVACMVLNIFSLVLDWHCNLLNHYWKCIFFYSKGNSITHVLHHSLFPFCGHWFVWCLIQVPAETKHAHAGNSLYDIENLVECANLFIYDWSFP